MTKDADKKECIHCAHPIPANAKYCTECNNHQGWRRYMTFSGSVLALLVALISVSTPLVSALKQPSSDIVISQIQGQLDPELEKEPNSRYMLDLYSLYATVSNLGDKPGIIMEIEPIKLGEHVTVWFHVRADDTFHEPGTRRIKTDSSIVLTSDENGTKTAAYELFRVFDGMVKLSDTKMKFTIRNFNDDKVEREAVVPSQFLMLLAANHIGDCDRLVQNPVEVAQAEPRFGEQSLRMKKNRCADVLARYEEWEVEEGIYAGDDPGDE